jgi:hypothetical protein
MPFSSKTLCTVVVAGLLTACSGTTLMSPGSAIPNTSHKLHQTMSLPCHCHPINPGARRVRRHI